MLNCSQNMIFYAILLLMPLLSSCASQSFKAGPDKNSLPLFEKKRVEEVHNLYIPPFYGDNGSWREIATETVAHDSGITIISSEETDAVMTRNGIVLSSVTPDERPEVLVYTGRSVRADAVLNGLIIKHDKHDEIILQLIATRDARMLWWQAADVADNNVNISRDDRKALLKRMISQFSVFAGTGGKPAAVMPLELKPEARNGAQAEQNSEAKTNTTGRKEIQQNSGIKKKPAKKRGGNGTPHKMPDTISPM